MNIKKILFLSIFLMMTLLFIPNIVNAELNLDGGAIIELESIKLGGEGQETTYAIGGEHFTTPLINITWYESTNGNDYTLMNEDSTFDYNTYYKAVLDTSYDALNGMMEEGWELGGISIHIIDETGETVESSSYRNDAKLEYVFEPFWKYKVYLHIDNMDYIGPTEIVEGEKFEGRLVPKKNYRLPYSHESYNINILIKGNNVNFYDFETGDIEIESWHINGDIDIYARAEEKGKVGFNNNKYSYVKNGGKNGLEFTVPFQEDIDTITMGDKVINNNYYEFDKGNHYLAIYDDFLEALEVGTYVLRIENNNRYAETTVVVQELEVVDKITIDFREISNGDLLSADQLSAFQYLCIDKGTLTLNLDLLAICDKNQKILLYVDEENNITLADNLSNVDNIVYTLSEEEIEKYKKEYAVFQVPKKIEIIFAEETYEVTFDGNGGKFTYNDKIVVDDIINFDYANFNKPTREGYKFIGFFTEKTGGKSFEEIMNSEAGIETDIIFYAQWEEITTGGESGIPEGEEQGGNNNTGNTDTENTNQGNTNTGNNNTENSNSGNTDSGNNNTENLNPENTNTGNTDSGNTNTGNTNTSINDSASTGKNPQTGDEILLFAALSVLAFVGIAMALNVKKYVK